MLSEVPESDDSFEKILDELEELEQDFPDAILDGSEKVEQMEKKLQSIRDEKRIIRQIKKRRRKTNYSIPQHGDSQRNILTKTVKRKRCRRSGRKQNKYD